MNIKKLVGAVLLLGLLIYGAVAVKTLRPFVRVHPQGGEGCRLLEAPGLVGAEDMEFDHASGTLWIVAADRRTLPSHRPIAGAVFRFQPDKDSGPQRVPIVGFSSELRPHGMGLWTGSASGRATDGMRLFTVQHGSSHESIEIFAIEPASGATSPGQLRHLRSVTSPRFISLNDVAPVGPEGFYATNDHGRPPPLGFLLEDFLFISRASIVYFDGQAARTVFGGLRYANGITADRGGRFLLVAEASADRIRVFSRQAGGELQQVSQRALGTGPDNFAQDERGVFWLAAHPSFMQFLRHSGDAKLPSASQAMRFQLSDDGQPVALSTTWLDDGKGLSASSVAAVHGRHMAVGGVFQSGILWCPR